MSPVDRRQAPEVGRPGAWAYPASVVTPLPGAAGLRLIDLPGQQVLSVEVVVPMPWAQEPRELEGLSVVLAATLDEGTTEHDAESLARAFEREGVDLEIGSSELGLMIGLQATPEHLAGGLRLLAELLGRATFPDAAVGREVRGRLFDIAQEMATPSSRAIRELTTLLHGAGSREGRPGAGSAETVVAITPELVREHHARWGRPDDAHVVVAGDLSGLGDEEALTRLVAAELVEPWAAGVAEEPHTPREDDLAAGEPAEVEGGPVADVAVGETYGAPPVPPARPVTIDGVEALVVHRPGAAQTEVRVAWLGPTRHDPEGYHVYAPLAVHVGASPASVLDEVLREEKGWTYGMRASFRPRHRVGEVLVSGSFTTDSTAEAVLELLRLLRGVGDGIEPGAAAAARDFALLTAPMRYATADSVAHEAAVLTLDGVGPEFTTRTLAAMAAADADSMAEQMTAAWRRWAAGRWVMVLVGDTDVWGAGLGL